MSPGSRRDLAFLLSVLGGAVLLGLHFFSGVIESWWVFGGAILMAGVLLGLAALVAPPFWWGIRFFTTQLKDPSHEARQQDET